MIKEQWICSLAEAVIKKPKVDRIEKMKIARGKDKKVVRVVEEMKKTEVKVLQGDEWQIERDLMLEKGKVYISKYESLRVEII